MAVSYFAAFLPAMTNSFIHVIMYSYYTVSCLTSTLPSLSKYLWLKKYLTIIQLVRHDINSSVVYFISRSFFSLVQIQFVGACCLGINGIRFGCDFPLWMQYALVIYMISFIVLFGNFYAKMYLAKGKRLAAEKMGNYHMKCDHRKVEWSNTLTNWYVTSTWE